jgi:hypothetical protein
MFFVGWAGVIARLGTVLVETDDMLFIIQNILSAVLNGTIVLQFFLYWSNTDKKVEHGGKKSETKK